MVLINRFDHRGNLNNFVVTIGNDPNGDGGIQCGPEGGDVSGKEVVLPVECDKQLTGRYVMVKLSGKKRMLSLCEIEIYGNYGK